MSCKVETVINIALGEVGYLEKNNGNEPYIYQKTANAGDKNYTKYGLEMHKLYHQTMDYPAAWCDAFVDWCFYKAYGIDNARRLLCGQFDDYTVASAALYKAKGAYYKEPQVGDQIFFHNGTRICHTGLVYKVDAEKVYTVEGNTSGGTKLEPNGGGVFKKEYYKAYARIDGYGRPAYDKQEFQPHWVHSSGKWYYRLKEGVNAHGWQDINHHRYYFAKDGAMVTDWKKIEDKWYYFDNTKDGALEGALWGECDSSHALAILEV